MVRFNDGFTMRRPAVFVFASGHGRVAWMESSYADPHGAALPALHFAAAARTDPSGRGIEAEHGSWSVVLRPYDRDDPSNEDARPAFDSFADWLRGRRRTWREERVRILEMIEGELPWQ